LATRTERESVLRPRRLAAFLIALICAWGSAAIPARGAEDVLILGRDTPIRQAPRASGKVLKVTRPGQTYEIASRKAGKIHPIYLLDEDGELWVKVRIDDVSVGFIRNDLAAVGREEHRPPRGSTLLVINQRVTADGSIDPDLWLVQEGWRSTRLLGSIEGRPIWGSQGEWFICQIDSGRPVKDPNMDRTVERIEKFSADGRQRTLLASGSYPILNETRGEVFFYRDVDDHGEPVPSGLFAVSVDGGSLRAVYLLPERYRFWREDGDFFVQAPPPSLHAGGTRIQFYAFEPNGSRVRFTVGPDGQFFELRRE
jgi:hypothetical protein